ncbi:MAG TPA: hypothetical protein VMG10_07300 [Gemmataceae bacterium]|nr:hypothetical protein [Gemmataceae bacterium]
MAKRQQTDGFERVLADHQNSSHYFEEADGSHRLWSELSAEGKLAYLAGDAALYDVPFERFQTAVRDVLGDVGPAVREEAALRLALRNEKQLHAVALLLPPDERLEGTPLPERVQEALAEAEARLGPSQAEERPPAEASLLQQLAASLRERKVRLADYVIYDTSEAVRDNLEAFGDEFERLARTPEQRQLAAAFQQFVGEFTGTGPKDAYRQMLAEAASAAPERDKDIER